MEKWRMETSIFQYLSIFNSFTLSLMNYILVPVIAVAFAWI